MAKRMEVKTMNDAVLNPNLTSDHKSLKLDSILRDLELFSIIKNSGISIDPISKKIANFHYDQRNGSNNYFTTPKT